MKRLFCLLLLSPLLSASQGPNIIYIMSDDHDRNAISAYNKSFISTPNIDRIAREGMVFANAFVGNSICGPARATLLTGQHSHKNGFRDNRSRFDSSKVTLPKLLQQSGYQTAMIGKWHLVSHPRGFDYWKIVPGQGQYFEPTFINMNGDTVRQHGYGTEQITAEALSWLKEKRDPSRPFALLLHHKAPHRNFFPSLQQAEIWHTRTFPEPSTLYEDTTGHGTVWTIQQMDIYRDMKLSSDLKVDPQYLMDIPWLKPEQPEINYYNAIFNRIPEKERTRFKEIYKERGELIRKLRPQGKELLKYKYQWYMQDYLACVASVDESVGRVLDYLDESGLAGNTLVIYTSDQGFYMGQNGWFDKRMMYDVSMRTPLLARWPGHIKPGSRSTAMVQNIDFAPTMLAVAGAGIPSWMQGISLKPVMESPKTVPARKSLYYHYYEHPGEHNVLRHLGVRTETHKLIYFYTVNEWQLFDLKKDPEEQKNLAGESAYRAILADLKKELIRLRGLYDDHEPAGELK